MSGLAVGGLDIMDVMAGGIPDAGAKNWLSQRAEAISTSLNGAGQAFFAQARDLYKMVSESQAIQMLRNLKAKSESVWDSSHIVRMTTLEQLQTASPVMQRHIMAFPELRQMYINQTVEGYADSYVNYHGDAVGEDHFDYRQVVSGIVQTTDDESDFVIKHYYDYLTDGEVELLTHEKIDILHTWDLIRETLALGEDDPTSTCGAQL